jgi:hypothetical protein
MSKRYTRLSLAAPAAVLIAGLGVSTALAATTWTVHPGGTVTAASTNLVLKDLKTGSVIECHSSITAALKSGSGLTGSNIGSVSKAGFSKCVGGLGITYTLTAQHLPWHLNAGSYNSSTGTAHGTISGVHAVIGGGLLCIAIVDGTGASKDNGVISVTYKNGTHQLAWPKIGGNLHFYKVNGCSGLIRSGDPAALSGTFSVSPPQTITSP